MSEYTIAGSARIINRPYRHPYRQRRIRHCSSCGSASHDRRTCQVRIREEQDDQEYQIERQNTIDTERVRREFQHVQGENRERRLLTPDTLRTPKKRIELVENFEKDTYLEKNENGDTNCNICLEDININSALVFQCGHGCCNKCAKTILRGNGNCHQCREPIRKIRICRLIPLDIFNSLNNYMKI
jgi:ferredoxin